MEEENYIGFKKGKECVPRCAAPKLYAKGGSPDPTGSWTKWGIRNADVLCLYLGVIWRKEVYRLYN